MKRYSVVAAFLLAAALSAQNFTINGRPVVDGPSPVRTPQEVPAGKSVLSGRVVNAKTKEPIKKANVALNGPVNLTAVTDGSGTFTFRALPPGGYIVSANHEAYYVSPGARNMARQIALADGEEKNNVELALMPGATMDGRVLDEDELPVSRCNVSAMREESFQGRPRLMNKSAANTDEEGRYHLQNLEQGRYVLKTRCQTTFPAPHGFMKRNDPMIPLEGYAISLAGAGDASAAAVPGSASSNGIPVTAGAELTGVDFHVKRVPVFTVRGVVSGADTNSIPGAQVALTPTDALAGEDASTPGMYDATHGQFTFRNVPAGSYELSAAINSPDRAFEGRQVIEVGKTQITEFDLKLSPGSALAGSLDVDDPNLRFDNMQVSLQPVGSNYRGLMPIATLDASGAFEFKSVLPGRFSVNPLPLGYIRAVTLAGRDVNPQNFEITGAGAGPLRISIGSKMAKVELEVTPRPAAGETVSGLLVPDDDTFSLRNFVSLAGANGEISFQGVPPGKYHAFALLTPNAWGLMNQPQILKALSGQSAAVEVAEGDDKHISAPAISADDLQKAVDEQQ